MIECLNYSPVNKGCCLGMCELSISKWGVNISGVTLYEKDGRRWVNLPYKYSVEDGVKKYDKFIKFKSKELEKKFCELAKDAIDRYLCTLEPEDYGERSVFE